MTLLKWFKSGRFISTWPQIDISVPQEVVKSQLLRGTWPEELFNLLHDAEIIRNLALNKVLRYIGHWKYC